MTIRVLEQTASPVGEPATVGTDGEEVGPASAADTAGADASASPAAPRGGAGARAALLALSGLAVVLFALYAAYMASRVEDMIEAQPISVPGGGPAGPFGSGTRAPDFELTSLDGRTVRLSDFAGRPVWINIFASWCAPCRAEMPDVNALWQETRARDAQAGRSDGLMVLLVSIGEDPAAVRQYFETTKYDLPLTAGVLLDRTFSITQHYKVNGLPTHYFIGRDGTIRDMAIGGLKPSGMRARIAKIA
jgi:cytochrome c biogenesis protein CcmG, thiol:disulfide interchange protein DsbE